jgi:hypothetical protein
LGEDPLPRPPRQSSTRSAISRWVADRSEARRRRRRP